jgi:subtilisin family serine protease
LPRKEPRKKLFMSNKNQSKSNTKLDKKVFKKLDYDLKRLLCMTDKEIMQKFEAAEAQTKERIQQIEQLGDVLSPTATVEERRTVKRMQRLYQSRLLPDPIFRALIIDKTKIKPIKVRAIIHFTGNRDDLNAMGLEVRTQAHDIFTVVGTTKQLADLAAQAATLRISLPVKLWPGVNEATIQSDIDPVRVARPENPDAYLGDDVIIAIIDTPLDVTHNAFRDPTGNHETRILFYWVQEEFLDDPNAPGLDPQGFFNEQKKNNLDPPDFSNLTGGRIYTESAINTALNNQLTKGTYGVDPDQICCEPEYREHGTLVAGVAVGGGHDANWNKIHEGSAPHADIVHVASDVADDHLFEALEFIFAIADKLEKPVVVNISYGGHYGPHLGTDNSDLWIDNKLSSYKERVVVGITQNWNDELTSEFWHSGFRHGIINTGDIEQFTFTPTGNSNYPKLHIYYSGPELEFQVSINNDSSGEWKAASTGFSGALSGSNVSVSSQTLTEPDLNCIVITMQNVKAWTPLDIKLRSSSKVAYYAWVWSTPKFAMLSDPTSDKWTLCSAGCCKSLLTVGSCDKLSTPNPLISEPIAKYSGAGPTLDGRIKPEIVAVGADVQTAVSDQYKNSDYGWSSGTSIAAPLIAGAVALLFQEARLPKLNYELNHDTIKALLTQYAKKDAVDDINCYGYGRLRLKPAIDHMRGPVNVDLWIRLADDDFGLEPYLGRNYGTSPDITVYKENTNEEIYELSWNTPYDVKVMVRNLGTDKAVDAKVSLKYTKPFATPVGWHQCANEEEVDVPALGQTEVKFKWTPKGPEEVDAPPDMTHFCLLAEARVKKGTGVDEWEYEEDDPWGANIGGNNNISLRNVIIK